MAYLISDIVSWAEISQPLARIGEAKKKATQSGTIELDLDIKLYDTRRDVEWQLAQETNATAELTITDVGDDGDEIEVFVDDPLYGSISLGSYVKQSSDTTVTILAATIAAALNLNAYGYTATSALGVITIAARPGLGETLTFRSNLSVVITPVPTFILINATDELLINSTDKFLI